MNEKKTQLSALALHEMVQAKIAAIAAAAKNLEAAGVAEKVRDTESKFAMAAAFELGANSPAESYAEVIRAVGVISDLETAVAQLKAAAQAADYRAGRVSATRLVAPIEFGMADFVAKFKPERRKLEERFSCDCGGIFATTLGDKAEAVCSICGMIKISSESNTATGRPESVTRSGYEAEHGKHRRHCLKWIERIQGIDSPNVKSEIWERLESNIDRYGIPRASLTCEIMREKFKELGLTQFNPSTPYFVKRLGGPKPPTLTAAEQELVLAKFLRMLELFAKACPENANAPYYPYFIYRVIEACLGTNPEKMRFLKFIHLQSHETIVKNDGFFKRICAIADPDDGLVYTPTIAWD